MNSLKNIIFDYGGVFVRLNEQRCLDEFKALGLKEITPQMNRSIELFQCGLISRSEFCEPFIVASEDKIIENQVLDAWRSMLVDLPKERIEIARKLSEKYNLYLLSNTDEVHINYMDAKIDGVAEFLSCFKKIYYSHQLMDRKPNGSIFEKVLEDSNLKANECLFVDDLSENCIPANELGIKTWWLDLSRYSILDIYNVFPDLK